VRASVHEPAEHAAAVVAVRDGGAGRRGRRERWGAIRHPRGRRHEAYAIVGPLLLLCRLRRRLRQLLLLRRDLARRGGCHAPLSRRRQLLPPPLASLANSSRRGRRRRLLRARARLGCALERRAQVGAQGLELGKPSCSQGQITLPRVERRQHAPVDSGQELGSSRLERRKGRDRTAAADGVRQARFSPRGLVLAEGGGGRGAGLEGVWACRGQRGGSARHASASDSARCRRCRRRDVAVVRGRRAQRLGQAAVDRVPDAREWGTQERVDG
jgi:hypothetical protein